MVGRAQDVRCKRKCHEIAHRAGICSRSGLRNERLESRLVMSGNTSVPAEFEAMLAAAVGS